MNFRLATIALVATTTTAIAQSTAVQQRSPQIVVGPEVLISRTDTIGIYNEYDADVDPRNPNRLIACAQPHDPRFNNRKITVHMSNDGGKTWTMALEIPPVRKGLFNADPVCAFAADGTALVAVLYTTDEPRPGPGGWEGFLTGSGMWVFRSTDNGRTWSPPKVLGFLDNQNLLVDRTGGRYNGRIYLHGNHGRGTLWLAYSTDNGLTFQRSEPTRVPEWGQIDRGTVLSDGTLVLPYFIRKAQTQPNVPGTKTYGIARSTDGGVTLSVPDTVMADRPACSERLPSMDANLAVDTASASPFRGRLYYLWGEIETRAGAAPRCVAVMVSSDDAGKTWSSPVHITDAPFRAESEHGPDARLAAFTVNSSGVVGVSWFDRREDLRNEDARLRFSASLDGGETWLPSVPVSTKMHVAPGARGYLVRASATGGGAGRGGRGGTGSRDMVSMSISSLNYQFGSLLAGDYSPLVAGANGVFHTFWVDNRGDSTKSVLFYVAPVTVQGTVQRTAEVAGLTNVTRNIEFQYQSTRWNRAGSYYDIDLGLVLKNVSQDTIVGPLKFRLLDVRSQLGPMTLRGSGAVAQGAVLDLTSLVPRAGLAPGASTALYEIKVRVGPVPTSAPTVTNGIANFSGKLFGNVRH